MKLLLKFLRRWESKSAPASTVSIIMTNYLKAGSRFFCFNAPKIRWSSKNGTFLSSAISKLASWNKNIYSALFITSQFSGWMTHSCSDYSTSFRSIAVILNMGASYAMSTNIVINRWLLLENINRVISWSQLWPWPWAIFWPPPSPAPQISMSMQKYVHVSHNICMGASDILACLVA